MVNIIIPDSVTSIGKYAFQGCSNMTTLTIPVTTAFGSDSFARCFNIRTLTLSKGKNGKDQITYYETSKQKWMFLPDS